MLLGGEVLSVSQGPAGLPGVIVIRPQSMVQYMVALGIAFVVTFVVTILFAKMSQAKSKLH